MKTNRSHSESGQTMLLGAMSMIVMLGFTSLAIDGGRIYSQERDAQNAADAAALAASRAMCTAGANVTTAARNMAAKNGYNNNGTTNWVAVNNPPRTGPWANMGYYAEIVITATLPSTMAHLVYKGPMQTTVHATGHCKPTATVFASSKNCPKAINLGGATTNVYGGLHSNNGMQISGGGQGNTITGAVTYVSEIDYDHDKTSFASPPVQTAPESYPIVYNINDYMPGGTQANLAAARRQYYSLPCANGGCVIDMTWLRNNNLLPGGVLQDGIYYTDGRIDLSTSTLSGNAVTFVARRGMNFSGSTLSLQPYANHLIAFTDLNTGCSSGVIDMHDSTLILGTALNNGNLYAPNGHIDLSSSYITLYGKLIGDTVDAHGHDVTMNSDPTYFIELAK